MDDLQDQIRAWTDTTTVDVEPVTADEVLTRPRSRRRRHVVERRGSRAFLITAAAAALIVAVVVTTGRETGEEVATRHPGPADDDRSDVPFEVLAKARTGENRTTMRSTSSSRGLEAMWAAGGFDGSVPVVDFATTVVVSITADGCESEIERFARTGSEMTPIFRRLELCSNRLETFVVALDWADAGGTFRVVLPLDPGDNPPAPRILDVVPPRPTLRVPPVVWPNDATTADRSSPEATARSFLAHLIGAAASDVAVNAAPPSTAGAAPVAIDFGSTQTTVLTHRTDEGWVVTQVGEASASISSDSTTARIPEVPGALLAEAWIETDLGSTTTWEGSSAEPGFSLPPGELRSIVILQRAPSGRILHIAGEGFAS